MSLALRSTAFRNGGEIPGRYTCSGANVSPALSWSGTPGSARSFALIVDDPDAPRGTWTHWLMWNLPASLFAVPEGMPSQWGTRNGVCQGRNDFGRVGYGGPCPPPGKPHRYDFRLYALDAMLELRAGSGRRDLERAMQQHIVERAEWMGTFRR